MHSKLPIGVNWTVLLGITAEALWTKTDFVRGWVTICAKFSRRKGRSPPIIFAQIDKPINALQLCRRRFSHKKNFVADFLEAKCNFWLKNGCFEFLRSLWEEWGLPATYDVHLRLIEKRVVDFLLMLIELFFARYYGWGATNEHRSSKISVFVPTGAVWSKISGRRGRPHQSFFL